MNTTNTIDNATPVSNPPTASAAIAGPNPIVKPEDELLTHAKSAVRCMIPGLVLAIYAVLKDTSQPANRAYIAADIMATLAGDRQNTWQCQTRFDEAGVRKDLGRLAGKLRKEYSGPLYQTLSGGTNEEEASLEDAEMDEAFAV